MIEIRLTGAFKEDELGVIRRGKVFIETADTDKEARAFLRNKANKQWLKGVEEKFQAGAGGDTR